MRTESLDTLKNMTLTVRDDKDAEEQRQIDSEILSMRNSGSTITEISESTGFSRYDVEQSVRAAVRRERENLENTPRSEILMESVVFLRQARDLQMAEAGELTTSAYKVAPNGEIVKKKLKIGDKISLALAKSKLVNSAVKFEKDVADLMVKTGVLPKQAEQIHVTMGDTKGAFGSLDPEEIEVTRDGDDIRNRQELLEDIQSHLVVKRRLKNSTIDVPKDAIVIEEDTEEIS